MVGAFAVALVFPLFLFFTQDRLIQLQNSARDSHESQISTLEKRSKKGLDRCIQLAELVEKTETKGNVLSTAYDKKTLRQMHLIRHGIRMNKIKYRSSVCYL